MDMLVIGLGNSDRGDDGVGLVAAAELLPRVTGAVRVATHEGEPTALVDVWRGVDVVMLIDATSSGAPAGTIHRFEAAQAPLPARHLGRSSHAVGPATAIELARILGWLPGRLVVYGIEGRSFDLGSALSAEVLEAVPALIERVMSDLDRFALGGSADA